MEQDCFQDQWDRQWTKYTEVVLRNPRAELRYRAELPFFKRELKKIPFTEERIYEQFTRAILKLSYMRKKDQIDRGGWYCGFFVQKQSDAVFYRMKRTFSTESLLDLLEYVKEDITDGYHEQRLMLLIHWAPNIPVRIRKMKDFLN